MTGRVLIVSPHFPPVNAPDMQRVRMSLPAFIAAGWEVTVLTVDDPTPSAPLEPELLHTLPAEVRIERVTCLSRRWTGRLGFNNVALRSLPFTFATGCRLLLEERYDVVYFSTTMFVVLPLGRLWRMFCGVPYVIDLQDPWVTDFYFRPGAPRPPGGWKYKFSYGLGRLLEGWTMRGAAQLIAVSAGYLIALRARYPALRNTPGTELPFGSPDPDLQFLRQNQPTRPTLLPPGGGLRVVFAGALGPGMLPAVEVLFAAIAQARQLGVTVSARFYGTSYSAAGQGAPVTLALAAKYGLQQVIHEQSDRLRYLDALQVTLEADACLLLGSSDLDFTPSKILAVLASGRPVISIAPAGSAMINRLAQLGQSCTVLPPAGFTAATLDELVDRLAAIAGGQIAPPESTATAPYSARAVADKQIEILTAAAQTA